MAFSKLLRKNQSSIVRVRVAIVCAMCLLVYFLDKERARLAESVTLSTMTIPSNLMLSAASIETVSSASSFVITVQSLAAQVRTFDTATVAGAHPQCLPFIFYDKPVKTGSTAVTEALSEYISSVNEPEAPCRGMDSCSAISMDTCSAQRTRAHLIQHVKLNSSATACLRNKGYYHVTSIREPEERIISAWKYARARKESHYGISYNSTFEEFLARFPKCALFHYYDLKPHACGTREEVIARAEAIVSRMDEIIDLDQEAVTDVHSRIRPFIANVNVASSGRSKSSDLKVPDEVVEAEYVLYNMLKEKRLSLAQNPRRHLCQKAQTYL